LSRFWALIAFPEDLGLITNINMVA
jgi:hypothetical protein